MPPPRAHRGRVRSTSLDFNYTLGARIDGRWGKSTFREPSHMLCFSTRDYAGLILSVQHLLNESDETDKQ
jgi:hypothetical protein